MNILTHIIEAKAQYVLAGVAIVAVMGITTVASAVATSTDSTATTSTIAVMNTTTMEATTTNPATTTPLSASPAPTRSVATSTPANDATPASAAPTAPTSQQKFKLAHATNGMVYTDYFTDGTKTISFPGDPTIDADLNKPDPQMPQHAGLKWIATSGVNQYDTPSGKLEVGDYVQQADGSYLVHVPASTYTDATSTAQLPDRIITTNSDPSI